MDEDRQLLDNIVTEFYNSVKESFFFRLKNNWKINTTLTIFALSFLFLVINIIPIAPGLSKKYFLSVFNFLINNTELPFQNYNFWTKWGLGSVFSLLLFGLAFIPFKYWDLKEYKKAIDSQFMNFCYAFTIRKELKTYLINGNETHLSKCISYLKKITSKYNQVSYESSITTGTLLLSKFREELKKQFEWIEFTDDTNFLIDNLSSIQNKITRRFEEKKDLEKVLPVIDMLTLFEFAKIKPLVENPAGIKLKDKKDEYFIQFANLIGETKEIEEIINKKEKKRNIIISTFKTILKLFSSDNILILFLSWLILLTILLVLSALIVLNMFNIEIDSTILTGILTAPFLGAITLTATIYGKNKK